MGVRLARPRAGGHNFGVRLNDGHSKFHPWLHPMSFIPPPRVLFFRPGQGRSERMGPGRSPPFIVPLKRALHRTTGGLLVFRDIGPDGNFRLQTLGMVFMQPEDLLECNKLLVKPFSACAVWSGVRDMMQVISVHISYPL